MLNILKKTKIKNENILRIYEISYIIWVILLVSTFGEYYE